MASSVLTLKKTPDMRSTDTRGRRKIDPSEWPQLLQRREQGATQAEIAREYGVSQGTVSQILKRVRAERNGDDVAEPDDVPANDDGADEVRATSGRTLSLHRSNDHGRSNDHVAASASTPPLADDVSAAVADDAAEPSAPQTATAVRTPGPAANEVTAKPDRNPEEKTGSPSPAAQPERATNTHPLAHRLRTASSRVEALVEAGHGNDEQLAEALHEVRRALAAIEIDAAKRASAAPRPPSEDMMEPEEAADGSQIGRIKFFKSDKGFGFIVPEDGGEDVFLSGKTVSAAGLDSLSQGDRVRFVPGPGSKGVEAKWVERAS